MSRELFTDVEPLRRKMMAAIRSRDTKPEMSIRSALHAAGYRYRVHVRNLPGCPDIVFAGRHIAVFVHGCFWHAHEGCARWKYPKTRTEYWSAKLTGNSRRDAANVEKLSSMGWKAVILWECEGPSKGVARLRRLLDSRKPPKAKATKAAKRRRRTT